MKRLVLAGLTAFAFLASGCVMVPSPYGRSGQALSADKCPPGHRWSDGRCHGKGKGHDPAKHRKGEKSKGKGKDAEQR